MNNLPTAALLEFLNWRDAQMEAISEQLENAFPSLCAELDVLVDSANLVSISVAVSRLQPAAKKTIKNWMDEQVSDALSRAEAELEQSISAFSGDFKTNLNEWKGLKATLPAAAGIGLLAASVAMVPVLVSFATVTTTSFLVFTTSSISIPLLALGATGVAIGSFAGSSTLRHAVQQRRTALKERLRSRAASDVLGIGLRPGDRYFLNDLQAIVLKAGIEKIGEIE